MRFVDHAPDLDTILTGDQPLTTIDLLYDQRQVVEELLNELKYLCPEAGGEAVITSRARARHRLTQRGVDGVAFCAAAHAARADDRPGLQGDPILLFARQTPGKIDIFYQ